MNLIQGLESSIERHISEISKFGKIIKKLRKAIEDNPDFRSTNELQIRIFTEKCKTHNRAIKEIRIYIKNNS